MTADDQTSPPPTPGHDPRTLAVARLRDDLTGLVAAIGERLTADVADLRAMGGADRGRFAATVERLAALCLDVLAARRPLTGAERDVMVGAGRAAALQGLAHGALSDAVHGAMSVSQDRLLAAWETVAETGSRPEELRDLVGALRDLELELQRAVSAGHAEGAGTAHGPAREALVRALLEGRSEPAEIQRQARLLHLDLGPPLHVAVIVDRAGDATGDLAERVAAGTRGLDRRAASPIMVPAAHHHPELGIVVLPRSTRRSWTGLEDDCQRLGLAAVHAAAGAVGEVPGTYRRLRAVTPIVGRCADLLGAVMPLADLLPYRLGHALLLDEQDALLRETLGPLLAMERSATRDKLLDTLRAVVAAEVSPSHGAAAHQLGVTANTVRNRLEAITELTGLSVEGDHLRLALAVRLLDLWAPDLPPPGDHWLPSAP